MSAMRTSLRVRAMSLIELLCVMAIIALLAALLLPALGQAKARAWRIQCLDHLHQVGVGFVSFAHDHNGHFPMAVPASAGGTLELARGGALLQGDFYFSFRHFQAASNELVTPRLLVCPADTRPPATSFATLSNGNLSYFIGVNAGFARPTSILAGDRNLTNDYTTPGTLVRLGQNHALRWTEELHRFKGNLLFSDGHVEEKNSPGLVSASGQVPAIVNLALPTARQPGIAASSPGGGSFPNASARPSAPELPDAPSAAPVPKPKVHTGAVVTLWPTAASTPRRLFVTLESGPAAEAPARPRVDRPSTNAVAASAPAKLEQEDTPLFPFAVWLAATVEGLTKKGLWWLYVLLLFVVVATLALRRLARGRKKPAANPHVRFR